MNMTFWSLFLMMTITGISADTGENYNYMLQWNGHCNFYDTVNISSGYKDANDNFIFGGVKFELGEYKIYDYIIENLTEKVMVEPHYRGCICKYRKCIRLCCLGGEGKHQACVKTTTLQVPTHEEDNIIIDIESHEYGILVGKPCKQLYRLEPNDYDDDKWVFLKNGSIEVNSAVANTDEYCFGQTLNGSMSDITTDVLLCYQEDRDVRFTVYPIGMLISIPFLIITFCVYAFIPELRNLHGKCLMCYVFSLTTFYVALCIVQLDKDRVFPETFECAFLGYTIYISVFLCFFWLNVMCYDIWSTFKGGVNRGRTSVAIRFLFYSLYAFGLPIFLTLLVFIIDSWKLVPEYYLPDFGEKRCWMRESRTIEAIYIYTPISIIMVINVVLYSVTAYRIWTVQKETSVIRNGESQKHSKMDADTDRFFLYLRLFIIMGVTWITESISWVFENSIVFYVSDFLNCIQGLIIFLLFVWKPKVKKLIVRRYRSIRKLPPATSQITNSRTETSRISSSGTHSMKHMSQSEKPMLRD
ncbi:hypothetical protein PVAND_011303 [Polypedilum vanderplanki]|uniref:G-protein coupled receptors family 2 profile 2 domain-containing protein n=1 Tax=Polypedilum vanderplanki TaxID=319348 RepID=A0A9J6CI50_POLVA|nr:hypothetical protein PVAND_011303 [Polypedilum vanderplanki]